MTTPLNDARDAPIEHFLAAVDARMRAEIGRAATTLPARTLFAAGGKRLRARLLWWSASATAPCPLHPENERLVRAATAIELAHLGSLIHDDIVDGGDTRRGIATLHHQYGVRVAAETGGALAHLANELVAPLGPLARRAVRRAVLATCRGQIRELAVPFVRLTPRARIEIMQEKTGAFFELAGALGAVLGGASRRQRAAVRRFARRFGVAFQIADDVLDLAGNPTELGRANGADLRDGVLTLPVLLATDSTCALAQALDRVRMVPDASALAACAELIAAGRGITLATSVALWWLDRAVEALAPLPGSAAAVELIALARASVARGLRPGQPRFMTIPRGSPTACELAESLVGLPPIAPHSDAASLEPRLTRLLEWFHPGLATMVSIRAQHPVVGLGRERMRPTLLRNDVWSPEAEVAADAVALAGAMTEDYALQIDPVVTLALVDALYCASIGLLNDQPDPHQHAEMAGRMRELGAPEAAPIPAVLPPPGSKSLRPMTALNP